MGNYIVASKNSAETARSSNSQQTARRPITFELAAALCPSEVLAEKLATTFVLEPIDYDGIHDAHLDAFMAMATALALSEVGAKMHFQRLVAALVTTAHSAGQFYSEKVTAARALTSSLANDDRDEDRDPVAGFESKAERARSFAAQMGLQSFAQLAAAEGALHAYCHITGEDWKPYVPPVDNTRTVSRQSALAELEAFN